jgi:hypothetical protein
MAKAVKKKKATPRKPGPKAADGKIAKKRAKAYSDMESHVCDLVSMGTITIDQFDKNQSLFVFAVGKLEDMLNEFRAHYYAEEFPT